MSQILKMHRTVQYSAYRYGTSICIRFTVMQYGALYGCMQYSSCYDLHHFMIFIAKQKFLQYRINLQGAPLNTQSPFRHSCKTYFSGECLSWVPLPNASHTVHSCTPFCDAELLQISKHVTTLYLLQQNFPDMRPLFSYSHGNPLECCASSRIRPALHLPLKLPLSLVSTPAAARQR